MWTIWLFLVGVCAHHLVAGHHIDSQVIRGRSYDIENEITPDKLAQETLRWIYSDINSQAIRERFYDIDDKENEITTKKLAQEKWNWIYPGTNWCGSGNIAKDFYDLGVAEETDACCRAHDYCPDFILSKHKKYNLTNTSDYTRLSCDCDDEFRFCLRDVDSGTANNIGQLYFNWLGTKCFRIDFPVTGCKWWSPWYQKCRRYKYNWWGKQKYQWFDVQNY